MEEQRQEQQVEQQPEQQPVPSEPMVPGLPQEKIEEVQKDVNAILEKHNVYLEVVPNYSLVIKPRGSK